MRVREVVEMRGRGEEVTWRYIQSNDNQRKVCMFALPTLVGMGSVLFFLFVSGFRSGVCVCVFFTLSTGGQEVACA